MKPGAKGESMYTDIKYWEGKLIDTMTSDELRVALRELARRYEQSQFALHKATGGTRLTQGAGGKADNLRSKKARVSEPIGL
jgi:hypothetical protein